LSTRWCWLSRRQAAGEAHKIRGKFSLKNMCARLFLAAPTHPIF
jgi:hypothetical protein